MVDRVCSKQQQTQNKRTRNMHIGGSRVQESIEHPGILQKKRGEYYRFSY